MSNDSGDKFFVGLLVGAVLGYAVGIFTAPRSGEETRGKFVEFNKGAKDKFVEFNKAAKEKFDELKHEAADSD
jgi:gas vesicle protein